MNEYTGFKIVLSKGDNPDNFAIKQANCSPGQGFNPTPQSNQAPGKSPNITGAIGVMLAKKALQFGVANYGNLTGDYRTEANINGAIEVGGLVGMMATGPIGIAVALSSIGLQIASSEIEKSKKRTALSFQRERVQTLVSGRGLE
jgi:hypothetical protein